VADLNDQERAGFVKLTGEDEANVADVNSNREIPVGDSANNGGVNKALTVGTSAVELKVGASVLPLRKYVTFQPLDNGVYFGYSSGVTIANGTKLFKNQLILAPIGAGTTIFFIADAAGKDVRIGEIA